MKDYTNIYQRHKGINYFLGRFKTTHAPVAVEDFKAINPKGYYYHSDKPIDEPIDIKPFVLECGRLIKWIII